METWQEVLRSNFTSWKDLAAFLKIEPIHFEKYVTKPFFPLNVPRRLAAKIDPSNPEDPILLQFLPRKEEIEPNQHFLSDPVGDRIARCAPKLLQKYHGRVLLLVSGACAMHCRFCFRQHFDYDPEKGFKKELELISQDSTIEEVILSGGDPLSLNNQRLKDLIEQLESIPHLKRLRFHTRFPIGIPERIDTKFLSILKESRFQIWFVIHCNHPNELDSEIIHALQEIQKIGAPVLNQAVLLKGVNDTLSILEQLFTILINNGIFPYYLHQLDKTTGTAHFMVEESKGKMLLQKLAAKLPGYAIPRYVQEIQGEAHKSFLS